ncbi:MAG: DUF2917 domain-containing protein [Ramlibacter sp.]|nr:DUF2917 domain-containing protein [Ramlibacter sp.]
MLPMTAQTLTQTQLSLAAPPLSGTWQLPGGRAITLQPHESGLLRVACGRLWVTFDGPHTGPPNDLGDHFIGPGEPVRLLAGQRLVAEAWTDGAPVRFSWDPLPMRDPAPITAVVQPLADLRLALVLGIGAAGRLVAGLFGVAREFVRRRGRGALDECAVRHAGSIVPR